MGKSFKKVSRKKLPNVISTQLNTTAHFFPFNLKKDNSENPLKIWEKLFWIEAKETMRLKCQQTQWKVYPLSRKMVEDNKKSTLCCTSFFFCCLCLHKFFRDILLGFILYWEENGGKFSVFLFQLNSYWNFCSSQQFLLLFK